ncbi:FAD/NAD-P-binding domain-containing protein [Mycena rosella]|uniref:FAD/NAD-P-binding domain-containing protein n=1 Tax=Mycena rosella TaxID=1033263 RepID=A0AAD7D6B0_MYCRO|nr:FAD/NAD-P-binding domain-containing protein [Mycena rosella]
MRKAPIHALAVLCVCPIALADPVCIVGAGPAGLTIANRLQAKGYDTVIFEKDAEVGGKCQAYYDEQGLFHPMGALLYSNQTYRETLPVIDASGVSSFAFGYTSPEWLYDWRNGYTEEVSTPLSELTANELFKEEIERYTTFWNTEFAPKAVIGYKNGVEGYTMSTLDWLLENDYPLLLLLFINGMVPYGYGDVRQTPILYMLSYFTPDILLFFAGQREGYIIDFHKVFVRYAATSVSGPIHLNTSITKIDRSGSSPVITYYVDGPSPSLSTQTCSKLVLAFPPVLSALHAANLDLTPSEKTIFSPVGIIKYWSGAVRVATPNGLAFGGFLRATLLALVEKFLGTHFLSFLEFVPWLPEAAGEPVALLRLFNQSDIATTYSWGKYRSSQTLAEAKTLLEEVISKINKDPRVFGAAPQPVTDANVKEFLEWDYFPHFDQPQLEAGYYAKFNVLQGEKNTYYASGLNGFETVEYAIRAGIDVAQTYFPSINNQ